MKIVQIGAKVGSGKGIGHGNAGDTAIGSAFNYLFEEEFPNHEITFMNCRKEFTKKDIEIINQHDFLIVSGGGLFLHDTFVNELSDWQWGINEKLIDKSNTLAIDDYEVKQVSRKLLRIVTSYVDYIKRTVWHVDEL